MPSTSDGHLHAPRDATVLVERHGALGRIRLNRPKALNSLTLEMLRAIDEAVETFGEDASIAAVLISGEGERGLCAGGDIKMMYDCGRAGDGSGQLFWGEEYRLNARLSHFPNPFIAFMDGIVMGGGVGISVYGSHRIVTERTKFAMPETGIGFFTDVGASWFLTRQPGERTTFMALTGEVIGAGDAIALGLADFFVPSSRLSELADSLARIPAGGTRAEVSSIVARFASEPPAPSSGVDGRAIDRLFAFDRVEDIVAALESDGSDFAAKSLATLGTRSPTSLKVTLRLLRLGRQSARIEQCLEREFAGTRAVLAGHDFYEGVRAAVIDKDRSPKWQPASLAHVTEEMIAAYFPKDHPQLFNG